MAGLDPAIHNLLKTQVFLDGRIKCGHDAVRDRIGANR